MSLAPFRATVPPQTCHTLSEHNSIDTFTVNRIVEQITGKPLNDVFSERFWQEIGAEADAHVVVSSQGYPRHQPLERKHSGKARSTNPKVGDDQ